MNYKSAFAIGDKAVMFLDCFAGETMPYGRIDGIMFSGEQVEYSVSLYVDEGGSISGPKAYLHEARPVRGFMECDLKRIEEQYVAHVGHVGRYEPVEALDLPCVFELGQMVNVAIDTKKEDQDFFNIPVKILSVRYEECKVIYDVCILREGSLVDDRLYGVDSIYIQPVGGWPALDIEPVVSGRVDSTKENQGNVPKSI